MTENSQFKAQILSAIFVVLLSFARISHGFFWAIPGPTLPSLEANVKETNVSSIFTYRSAGVFVGSCLSGYFFPKLGSGKWKLFSLGVILCIDALGLAVMPILKDMWILATVIMITGATSGWLNSGITSLFLTTWGPDKSRPYIASFHFTFSIGAILAPFLVGLYKPKNQEKQCDNQRSYFQNTKVEQCNLSDILCDGEYFEDLDIYIIPPYWIVATGVLFTGICMTIASLLNLVEKVNVKQVKNLDIRKEDPWNNKEMILYFFVTMMIFFCAADMDTIFSSYLYIYGMCSETFDLSAVKANNLVTIFWSAFAFGRLSGVFLTKYIASWIYILVDAILSLLSVSAIIGLDYLLPSGTNESTKEALLIACVVIFAIFVSCIYGCATNFTNEYTNMSLSYIYLTQAGNSIGVMTLPAITGVLVKTNPVWMCWIVLFCTVSCLLFELLIWRQGLIVQNKFAIDHILEDDRSSLQSGNENPVYCNEMANSSSSRFSE